MFAMCNMRAFLMVHGFSIGSGRSLGEGNGNQLQYSSLGNSMDKGAWQGYSPWVAKELDGI